MSKRKQHGRHKKGGKKARNALTVNRGGYVRVPRVARFASPLPRELSVSLTYKYQDIRTANVVPSSYRFGLFYFMNQLPMYAPELFQIYKFAKIDATRVHAEVINTGTYPIKFAMAAIPYNDGGSTVTPNNIEERPGAIVRCLGLATGMSRVAVTKSFNSLRELGSPVYSRNYWEDYSSAVTTAPSDIEAPCIIVATGSTDGSAATCAWSVNYDVTYSITFFNLKQGAVQTQSQEDHFSEEGDDTDQFEGMSQHASSKRTMNFAKAPEKGFKRVRCDSRKLVQPNF